MRARFISLCASIMCLATAELTACSTLKSAGVSGEELPPDGGEPENEPVDAGRRQDTGTDAGSAAHDAGPTCPIAPDRPAALAYVTTTETVFDSVTNLMWERVYRRTGSPTYDAAATTCAELRTAGHADWRVPTRSELFSIVDYAQGTPKISRQTFPGTVPDPQWTSSKWSTGSNDVWMIDLFGGSSTHFDQIKGADGGPASIPLTVRCVRTVDPPCTAEPRFVREGSVVLDRVSGLEWSTQDGSPRGPAEAIEYCKALAGAADRPWRVPSIKESDSLVTGSEATGYLAPAFPTTAWTRYWTATRSESGGLESSYALDRSTGNIRELVLAPSPMAVRCVR